MKNSVLTLFAVIMGIAFIMGDVQGAYSQESDFEEFTLEEIIVTAQKREQQVQDVPIAMTVTTSEQIERQMVHTLQDLGRTTPGLEFGDPSATPGGGGSIRGIGTAAFDGAFEPSVGVVLDGVSLGTSNIGNIFDVERVEVLRGPQGTLFGNSASAGVIQIVTASPDTTGFQGKVSVDATKDDTIGSKFGRQQLQAMINVPITEKSAFRLTGNGNFTQGLRKGQPGQEDGEQKNTDFRAKYLLKTSEDFSLNLIADYAQRKSTGPNLFTSGAIIYGEDGEPINPALANWIDENCPLIEFSNDNQYTCTDVKQFMKSVRYSLSAEASWTMANHDFINIISYRKNKMYPGMSQMLGISSPIMFEIIREGGSGSGNNITEEFRVSSPYDSKLSYLGGIYYSRDENNAGKPGKMTLHPEIFPGVFITVSPPITTQRDTSFSNYAAFADANYPLADNFKLLGGVRYSSYKINIDQRSLIGLESLSTDYSKSYFSWRAGGQYDINKDVMIYGTISRGVKTPVIQPPDISTPDEPSTIIKAELPTSYEIGTKLTAYDKKLALDFNAFYTKVKDYQGQECHRDEGGALNCGLTNIDGFESKGFEIDVFGQPMQNLKINTGYILAIAEYPDPWLDSETGGNLGGKQIMYTPRHKFIFSGEYGKLVTENIYGFFSMDAVYKSERRLNTYLYPESVYPACWNFGSNIGVRDKNDKWTVGLFGRNLFNENEPVAIYPDHQFGLVMNIFSDQSFRQVGITASFRF